MLKGARVMRVNVEEQIYYTTSWIRDFEGFIERQDTLAEACNRTVNPTLNPNATAPIIEFVPQTQCCTLYGDEFDTKAHKIASGQKSSFL